VVGDPVLELEAVEDGACCKVCVDEGDDSEDQNRDRIDGEEEEDEGHPALLILHVRFLLIGDHLLLCGTACDDGSALGAELHVWLEFVATL